MCRCLLATLILCAVGPGQVSFASEALRSALDPLAKAGAIAGHATQSTQPTRPDTQIDFSQADLMLALLHDIRSHPTQPAAVDPVMNAEGTALIVKQLNLARRATQEQYRQLLLGLREERFPDVSPVDSGERARQGIEGLKQVWANLQWALANLELLEARLAEIRRLDGYEAARSLAMQYLPEPSNMTPRLFIVVGGRVGAAALDGGRVYVDTLAMSARAAGRSRSTRPAR